MDKKKIEDFITRLSDPNLPEEQQSFILQSEDDDVCAGGNNSNCTNYYAPACSDTNYGCTNRGVCDKATNSGTCKNLEPIKVDTDCNKPANTFICF